MYIPVIYILTGFQLSNATLTVVATRYSDKDGFVDFDDFVTCIVKLKTMFGRLLSSY